MASDRNFWGHNVVVFGWLTHPAGPPSGGHKQSGIGAENSLHGLGEYTNWQTVTLNKDPDAV
jgi:acyl-CoA reductase-like NAD-dependent aldehyde dehydrogenase